MNVNNSQALTSQATQQGDHYFSSGTKLPGTSVLPAELATIVAASDTPANTEGTSCFLSRSDSPGRRLTQIEAGRQRSLHAATLTDAAEAALADLLVGKCYSDTGVHQIYESTTQIRCLLSRLRTQTNRSKPQPPL